MLVASCFFLGGCSGDNRFELPAPSTVSRPFALNEYFVTSPGVAATGQLHASNLKMLPMTYEITDEPEHGSASLGHASGILTYVPESGFTGRDSLTYRAHSAGAASNPATVEIYVNPNPPTVSAFGAPVYVHDGGPPSIEVSVRLSNPPNGQATVAYTTVDGTARAGTDYTAVSGVLHFGPGVLAQTVSVPLSGVSHQTSRSFYLKLSNPSSNLTMGRNVAVVLMRYYPVPLNDTGVTGCATFRGNPSDPGSCPQAGYPVQDAQIGRTSDAAEGVLVQVGSGAHGYDMTALGFDGEPMFFQKLTPEAYTKHPWACVRDNWTGLVWEVPRGLLGSRTRVSAGLYSEGYVYSWYNPDRGANGGDPGKAHGGPRELDTHHFVQKANAAELCGFSDWRLPTAAELRNLVNFGAPGARGRVPTAALPGIPTLVPAGYWTATPGDMPQRATVISTAYGYDSFLPKNSLHFVILVRGGASR